MNVLNAGQVMARATSNQGMRGPTNESEGWSFTVLIEIILRRFTTIVWVAAAALVLGIVYLLVAEPKFTATTTLIPDMERTPSAPSEVTRDTLIDPAIVENQIETIKSKKIALSVIDKLSLWKDSEFVGTGPGSFSRVLSAMGIIAPPTKPDHETLRYAAANSFARMLKVFREGRSYVTDISFTSKDPAKAALIANNVADAYIQDQLSANFSRADLSSQWMQQRIDELAQQAATAAKAVEDYKAANNLSLNADSKPPLLQENEELATSLEHAKADTINTNTRIEHVQAALRGENRSELPDSKFLESLNDPTVNKLLQEYRDTQRATAPQTLTGRNQQTEDPEVAVQLAKQRNAIWDAIHAANDSAKKSLESARLREAAIVQHLNDIAPQVRSVRAKLDKLQKLEAQYQNAHRLHDALQNRFARVSDFVQQQSLPVTEARVIAEATPPLKESSPKHALILSLAVVAGGILGLAAALILEYFDGTITRSEQIENVLGLWSLGALPRFNPRIMRRSHTNRVKSAKDISQKDKGISQKDSESGLRVANKFAEWLSGAPGETLRYVKVAVDDDIKFKSTRIFAVISPNMGEGKTTVALALAMLAASGGKRTLLIDADVRDPSLTRMLKPGAQGLLTLALAHHAPFIDGGIRHELGFDFLGLPGPMASHPSDLLASDAMRDVLEQLRGQYDYVIVDTPALKPYVDVAAAASFFDAFVMIAEWGRTALDDISSSLAKSTWLGERLVGVLINKSKQAVRG